ncbi:MAG: lipopolysaccharide biosynthesis protein [Acetobacteraceae bacterium]
MVAFRLFSRLLGLAGTLVVARLLTPADFGVVAVAATITAATDSVTELGVQDSLIRYKGEPVHLYDTAFTIQAIRAVLSGLILFVMSQFADRWFGEPRLEAVLLVLAGVYALSGFENIGVVEFRRQLRFNSEFLLSAVPRLLGFLTTVTTALTLRTYWALVLGIAITKLARLVYSYRAHAYRPRFALQGWRDLAGMTFWTWMSALAYILWNRSDAMIIGSALGAAKLGLVVMASDIAQLPTSELLGPTGAVLFTAMAAARNDGSDINAMAFPIAIMLFMLLTPLAILASALSGDIVATLLGQNWSEAQTLVAILAWLGLFAPFTYVSSVALTAGSKLKLNFFIVLASSLVKIALLSGAVRTGDIRLVALASIGTAAVEGLIFILVLHRQGARLRPVAGAAARIAVACLACVGALAATGVTWQQSNLPPLQALLRGGVVGVMALLVYGGTLLLVWRLAGSPPGPEADSLALARQRLTKLGRSRVVTP